MPHKEGVGACSAITEIAWIQGKKKEKNKKRGKNEPITEKELIEALCERYHIDEKQALGAINMAKRCNQVEIFIRLKE